MMTRRSPLPRMMAPSASIGLALTLATAQAIASPSLPVQEKPLLETEDISQPPESNTEELPQQRHLPDFDDFSSRDSGWLLRSDSPYREQGYKDGGIYELIRLGNTPGNHIAITYRPEHYEAVRMEADLSIPDLKEGDAALVAAGISQRGFIMSCFRPTQETGESTNLFGTVADWILPASHKPPVQN